MTDKSLQLLMLDLYDHVHEPLDQRQPFHTPFSSGPVISSRDAASVKDRLSPDLVGIGILPRGRIFSTFRREHMNEAFRVIQLLEKFKGRDLQLVLAYLRDNINEELFVYSTSVFISHSPSMRNVRLPPIEEVLPEKFLPAEIFSRARIMQRRMPQSSTEPIIIDGDFTGNDLDPEHRLAYWREDVGLNAHHWHWHIVYPFVWVPELGGLKDRKGELFYYMHQQMICRYEAERLSNNFARVASYHNWLEPIAEGYAPHLSKEISGTVYSFRPANMKLHDLPDLTLNRLVEWYSRITQSIHRGYLNAADNSKIPLDEKTGIDKLGDLVEASATSVNTTFYGDFHNRGHDAIARIHDPDERYKEEMGVMGDSSTAMRDPVFYRWHKLIDNLFQEHKNTLTPYTPAQLLFKDIVVEKITIQGGVSQRPNNLRTFWQEQTLNLQRGVAFDRPSPVSVRIRHLQHESFSYKIEVTNKNKSDTIGTVRIFMAPLQNEVRQPFTPNDQRILMMEMDKFETTLKPGKNVVTRKSEDSNVTVSSLRSFGQLVADAQSNEPLETQSACNCGLPDHLLIPRGKPEGMQFQTYVMITNSLEDRVNGKKGGQACEDATSYCGILNEKYPDSRAMGYPFDRRIEAISWQQFKTENMAFGEVNIRFSSDVVNTEAGNLLFPNN